MRSDVYSLGVLFFELLAGRLPYDLEKKMLPEMALLIQQQDPTPLSAVDRAYRGDLETIAGKALQQEQARRLPDRRRPRR